MQNYTIEMAGSNSEPEDQLGPVGILVEKIVQEAARGDAKLNVIELDDDSIEDGWTLDEQAYDADILKIESESIDLTNGDEEEDVRRRFLGGGESDANLRCQHYMKGVRNPCLCGHHDQESDYHMGDTKVRKNSVHGLKIELRVGRFIVDFIEIKEIWVHRITGAVLIRGFAYTRTRNLDGRLQAYKNEVCRLVEIDTNDYRPVEEQSLIEVALEDLHPKHRVLHVTNKSFPECRFDTSVYKTNEDREELAPLTARWVHTMQYPDKRYRRAQRPIDGEVLAHFREGDVLKARHRETDSERLRKWRGDAVKGGAYVSRNMYERIPTPDGTSVRFPRHRFTAADMFSGAGGYTAGAKRAGINVVCALDHWARCNATYKANHPEVDLKEQDIMTYCNDLTVPDVRFDLVHLSPPCQTWSPAHTCAGKNDSANIAALYACTDIIFRFRPRIVTFEQTFGIIQERHLPWFNALVQSLTKYEYSLMWKVIRLVEYGLPQNRKRLIMIGAAPGEQLPPFPTPTHAAEPGPHPGQNRQKQIVSAIKACRGLVDGMRMHDPSGVKQMQRQPWDGNQPMNRTITTSGGQAYHWDGERDLTLAEFARLQGFPENYVFKAPCIKKQIGNAFPPTVVHAIMKQIVRSLETVDNMTSVPREEDIVHIDDVEDDDEEDDSKRRRGDAVSASKREGEPEPKYTDSPNFFESINSVPTEKAVKWAVLDESGQIVTFRGQSINAAGHDGPRSPHNIPAANAAPNLATTSAERVAWAGASQVAHKGIIPRASSQNYRRRSSGGSSVVFTGQRQLPTIIEDDEDGAEGGGECVDARQLSSSDKDKFEEDGGQGNSNAVISSRQNLGEPLFEDLEQYERDDDLVILDSSPLPGALILRDSHNPFFNAFDSVARLSHCSRLRSQVPSSSASPSAPSSSDSAPVPSASASQWQEEATEDNALVRAVAIITKEEIVQRHALMEHEEDIDAAKAFMSSAGPSIDCNSGSRPGSGSLNPFRPLTPVSMQETATKEPPNLGKGEGMAAAKRPLDGADDCDTATGSPIKKCRIGE